MEIKQFDQFFYDNPNPMLVVDPDDFGIEEVNNSAEELYGYSRDELLASTLFDLCSPDEQSRLRSYVSGHPKSEFTSKGNWIHQTKEGARLSVQLFTHPITYQGKVYKLEMIHDITDQQNYQQRYEMIFDHSIDGIMLTNPSGDIIEANPAACQMLGMSEQEIVERGREGLVVKDEKLEQALKRRTQTGSFTGELTFRHKSGQHLAIEITTSIFTDYSGKKRTSMILRDISERKEIEYALRDEKEFTDTVLSSLPGVFYVLDSEGRIQRFNNRATTVFGQSAEEIKGRSAADFVHSSDKEKIPSIIKRVLDEGYSFFELRLLTANDNTAVYSFGAERLTRNGEQFIVGTGVDISEQKELQKKLEASLSEKEMLLSEIHHRVKNNLAIITSMMELQVMDTESRVLKNSLISAQQRIQTIAGIHEVLYGSENLSHINFSKNIEKLIHSLDAVFASDKKIAVQLDVDHVLMNINQAIPCALLVNEVITNAYKHAFKGRQEGTISVDLHEEHGRVHLVIWDDGVGLPEQFSMDTTSSIGMTLIELLNRQLEGDLKFENSNGTHVKLSFKKSDVKGIGSNMLN